MDERCERLERIANYAREVPDVLCVSDTLIERVAAILAPIPPPGVGTGTRAAREATLRWCEHRNDEPEGAA